MGFGTHPHRDMEIISIPTAGKLAHKDTIGTSGIIESGEIQVMSAGTGIAHSEMNGNADVPVKFFQIWVMPNKQGVEPRYQQLKIADMLKPMNLAKSYRQTQMMLGYGFTKMRGSIWATLIKG